MTYGNRLDVVLKIAERCNLACPYCYYFFQEHNPMARRALIEERSISAVKEFLKKGVRDFGIQTMGIGLHGGEPTLMPKKRFDTYLDILRELEDEVNLGISMQTNGTFIDDQWIDLFEKHRVNVGVSIDGPKYIHDANRPDHKGRGSYDDAVRGLRLLQQAAIDGRIGSTGVLSVANPEHDGAEIVRHVVEELKVDWFNLLLPREGFDAKIQEDQERWLKYFAQVMHAWEDIVVKRRRDSGNMVIINEVSGILNSLLDDGAAVRQDWMNSNRHFILTISSEGDLGPDDNIMALEERFCNSGMNVTDHSMYDFFASDFWKEFNDAVAYVPEQCSTCEWYRSCRSGHLFNRYSSVNGFKNPTVFCQTIQHLHQQLLRAVVQGGIADFESIVNRLKSPPVHHSRDFMKTGVTV